MQDILNRELVKGDIFLKIGRHPRLGIVTQSDNQKVAGVFVHYKRNPTTAEQQRVTKGYGSAVNYYNCRYELKFGKISCRDKTKLVKISLADLGTPNLQYFNRNNPSAYLQEDKLVIMKERFLRGFNTCVEYTKENKKIVVPKEDKFV